MYDLDFMRVFIRLVGLTSEYRLTLAALGVRAYLVLIYMDDTLHAILSIVWSNCAR